MYLTRQYSTLPYLVREELRLYNETISMKERRGETRPEILADSGSRSTYSYSYGIIDVSWVADPILAQYPLQSNNL